MHQSMEAPVPPTPGIRHLPFLMGANASPCGEILGFLIPSPFLEQFQILKGFIVDGLTRQKLKETRKEKKRKEKLKHFFQY